MLKEVELVVLGFNVEVWTIDFNRTGRACAKWRVGKDDIHQGGRFFFQNREGVARLEARGLTPMAITPTLEDICRAMDEFPRAGWEIADGRCVWKSVRIAPREKAVNSRSVVPLPEDAHAAFALGGGAAFQRPLGAKSHSRETRLSAEPRPCSNSV